MRIKKLELIGFKSFKDKTVIHFDHGITGIVGPNGCGKSNIVDALVWVMGEMSAKHLRGSSMEDVIFAGAENYAPMGLCEVSLTLENDGGAFPAKYMRFSEIMMTRRLHRSGESEYFINKEPARLRDIQEIFMDTGAGSKGFSIIEQGAIGKIITAKPEDRRTLIEEAAGITKFKARKRESQRKLESTDQNLVRLQDILGEQKRQLESLERQAQRAERFRNLRTQVQDKEVLVSAKSFLSLREEINELDEKLQRLIESEAALSAGQSQRDSDLQSMRLNLLEKEKDVEIKGQAHVELVAAVQRLENEIRELGFEMEQARRNREMTGGLLSQYEARKLALTQDLELTTIRHEAVQSDVQTVSAQWKEKAEGFSKIQARITELDNGLTTQRREMLTLAQTESHLDSRSQSLSAQISGFNDQIETSVKILEELKNQKTDFEKRRNKLFGELEFERQMQLDIMKDVENFEENLALVRGQHMTKVQDVETFKDHLNQVSSRLYGLENLQASFEGFEDGVKNVMLWQRARHEVHADGQVGVVDEMKPMAEVLEVPEQYELAMEGALGSRLQMLLSQKSETALGAVDYLKEKRSGRSSFIAGDLMPDSSGAGDRSENLRSEAGVMAVLTDVVKIPTDFEPQVRGFLKNVAVVESIRSALSLRPQYAGWTFVTIDGDTLSQDGVLTGGTAESAQSGVIQRRREIKELSIQREEAAGKLALAQVSLKKLDERLKTLTDELENSKKKNSEKELQVVSLQKDLERAETELRNANVAVERSDLDLQKVQGQKGRVEDDLETVSERLTEIREKKLMLEMSVTQADEELKNSREGVDDLQREVTDLQVRLAQKEQELKGLQSQLEILQRSQSEVVQQLSQMSSESEKSGEVLSTHQVLIEAKKVELERRIREAGEAKALMSAGRDEFEQLATEVRALESSMTSAVMNLGDVRNQKSDSQLKVEQLRMKEQYLTQQISERYMIQLADVADQYRDQDVDVAALEAEVADMKSRLSKIGDVNLSAIQEFDDLKVRFEFLNKQYTDLTDSKDQLRRVIERINRICSKRFKETFELVNARFTTVFPVLFGGGEAHLTLIEDPEKDEVGIDIVARPPGKKMQNVTLLSGGEKALTAVSLIFSIFLVKPSPFCLLDEVDAPLDDANVSRFNDLVKEMAKRSQIIVVTHNKHTMKVNNILYGVTMEEKGVSKMVSVNLNEAEKVVAG